MNHKSEQLVEEFADLITSTVGKHCYFGDVSGYESVTQNSIVFIQNSEQATFLNHCQPAIIVTQETQIPTLVQQYAGLIIGVQDVRLAQALIKQRFDDYQAVDEEWESIHPSAVIHPTAQLGNNVRIGPNTVIGANCSIGDNTVIRTNSVIEHNTTIGQHCVIHHLVNIGYQSQLGNRVIIRSGCVIGSEGFGFAQGEDKRYHRIPHTGQVILHDDVQVGANCNIDRGTYGQTVLQRGVKLDSLCHISHNVDIGEDTVLASQTSIAGSSVIGKRVIASGQTGIIDHRKIADDVILVHRCGVTEDIETAGMWAGTPAKPFREYVQNLALTKKIQKLERRLNDLSSKLDSDQ